MRGGLGERQSTARWILVFFLGLFLGSGGTVSGQDASVIRIGAAFPLTGPIGHLGKDAENGVRLALEDIRAAGVTVGGRAVQFELLSEDDQADPRQATIVAQKLVDAGVVGVIGHGTSGTSIPASRIYHAAGIPQVSPSASSPLFTDQGYETTFRVVGNDLQQGRVLGKFATGKLNAKNIAIIDDRSAYGQGLAQEFERAAKVAGASIVSRQFTDATRTDFAAILTAIKGKTPDVIFFAWLDAQAGPMVRQIRNLGIGAIFLAGDGVQSQQFLTLGGPAAEGTYASSPGVPLEKMADGQAFERKYKLRFKQEIQLFAPYAYDATKMMVEAMRAAGSTEPDRYRPELAKIKYRGVTGEISFDMKGDLNGAVVSVYRVRNGKWERVDTFN
jgi:branched-chain amino acid transport system substrate-binding protein